VGRVYTAQFNAVAVTAAQDYFEINAAAGKPVKIHWVEIGQNSDAGDAQAEMLRILLITGFTTSGSGGTTPTAGKTDEGDAAFSGTVEVNNTTVANTGTTVTRHAGNFNVQQGYTFVWTPETRPLINAGGRAVFNMPVAPADSLTMSGTVCFEEFGG